MNVHYENVPSVSRMDKVVAYNAGSLVKIVAITETDYPVAGSQMRQFGVLEADCMSGSVSSLKHRMLFDNYASGGSNLEVAYELIKTRNYLAIIGYNNLYAALSIRRCDPNSVLSSDMDCIYYYPSTTHDVLSKTHSTAMGSNSDNISVSYLTNSYGTYYATCIRGIDLYTMSMFSSQEIPTNEKSEPLALKYMENSNTMMLAQSFTFPVGAYLNTNFLLLKEKCMMGYISPVVYRKGALFNAACINDVGYRDVVAVSCDLDFFVHDMVGAVVPSTPYCPYKDVIQVGCVNLVHEYSTFHSLPSMWIPCVSVDVTESVYQNPVSNVCESH